MNREYFKPFIIWVPGNDRLTYLIGHTLYLDNLSVRINTLMLRSTSQPTNHPPVSGFK